MILFVHPWPVWTFNICLGVARHVVFSFTFYFLFGSFSEPQIFKSARALSFLCYASFDFGCRFRAPRVSQAEIDIIWNESTMLLAAHWVSSTPLRIWLEARVALLWLRVKSSFLRHWLSRVNYCTVSQTYTVALRLSAWISDQAGGSTLIFASYSVDHRSMATLVQQLPYRFRQLVKIVLPVFRRINISLLFCSARLFRVFSLLLAYCPKLAASSRYFIM